MPIRNNSFSLSLAATIFTASLAPGIAAATIVEVQTDLGNFEINLYDNATPATVTNFLNYVNNGGFTDSIIHRSATGFVIQGGGFTVGATLPPTAIPANPAVVNEPEFSNVRGTISMAKLSGDPDSATSQWFINLVDNSAGLDGQNGGFAVFGEVTGNGMDVVDAIAALPTFDFSGPLGAAFGEFPLQNYTATDFNNNVPIDSTNPVSVSAVVVTDTTVDTAAGLNPPPNNANSGGGGVPPFTGGGGGGGSVSFFALFALLIARRFRVA